MAYFVEIFLPVTGSDRNRENLSRVRDELTTKFGGVTMLLDWPAEGLWKDEGDVERDRIVIAEVMTDFLTLYHTHFKRPSPAQPARVGPLHEAALA